MGLLSSAGPSFLALPTQDGTVPERGIVPASDALPGCCATSQLGGIASVASKVIPTTSNAAAARRFKALDFMCTVRGRLIDVTAAASRRVNAKNTPTLMNCFEEFFLFIRCFSFGWKRFRWDEG